MNTQLKRHTLLGLAAGALALTMTACAAPKETAAPTLQPTAAPMPTAAPTATPAATPTATPISDAEMLGEPIVGATTLPITPDAGQIAIYGEGHGRNYYYATELAVWQDYYAQGMRDLFLEFPYAWAQTLNLWMQAEDDAILERLYEVSAGAAWHTQDSLAFCRQIKETCPETVFHGYDISFGYDAITAQYGNLLEEEGKTDSEEYALFQNNNEQYEVYRNENDVDGTAPYRENCMVENFSRQFEALDGASVMVICGNYHAKNEASISDPNTLRFAAQLMQKYGDAVQIEDLQFGGDGSMLYLFGVAPYMANTIGTVENPGLPGVQALQIYEIFNAYEDVKELETNGVYLPCSVFPVEVKPGGVYRVGYFMEDGSEEWYTFRADGEVQNGESVVTGVTLPPL